MVGASSLCRCMCTAGKSCNILIGCISGAVQIQCGHSHPTSASGMDPCIQHIAAAILHHFIIVVGPLRAHDGPRFRGSVRVLQRIIDPTTETDIGVIVVQTNSAVIWSKAPDNYPPAGICMGCPGIHCFRNVMTGAWLGSYAVIIPFIWVCFFFVTDVIRFFFQCSEHCHSPLHWCLTEPCSE